MSSHKKAVRKIMSGSSLDSLPRSQKNAAQRSVLKTINEISGAGLTRFNNATTDFREFPCQVIKGAFARIPKDAKPTYNENDGLWYLNNELIVSQKYHNKIIFEQQRATQEAQRQVEQNIKNLKPETLGTE